MNSIRHARNMYLNIIIVSITIFLLSISVSLISNDITHINDYNNMYMKNNLKVTINKSEVINDLVSNKGISIISENSNFINGVITKGVYFKDNPFVIPVDTGRNFQYQDIIDNSKNIIVGKKMKDLIITDGSKKYINVFGENYNVIGVTENDVLEHTVFVNLDLIDNEDKGTEFILCSNTFDEKELINLVYKYQEIYPNSIEIDQQKLEKFTVNQIFERYSEIIENYTAMLIISMLALFTTTILLAEKIKSEIYIRVLCGASSSNIIKVITIKSSVINILSVLISCICQFCLSKIPVSKIGYYNMNIYNFILILSICIFINIVLLVVSFKYFKQQSISSGLKEI